MMTELIGGLGGKGALRAAQAQQRAYAQAFSNVPNYAAFQNAYVPPPESAERWLERLKGRVEQLEALDLAMPPDEHSRWTAELDAWAASI